MTEALDDVTSVTSGGTLLSRIVDYLHLIPYPGVVSPKEVASALHGIKFGYFILQKEEGLEIFFLFCLHFFFCLF